MPIPTNELIDPFRLPHADYHDAPGENSTKVKTAAKDLRTYMARYEPVGRWKALQPEQSDSDAFLFGTLVHDRALLNRKGWVGADVKRRSTLDDGRLQVARRLQSDGSLCQRDLVGCTLSVREALRKLRSIHVDGNWLMEHSAFADIEVSDGDELYQFRVKARPDILLVSGSQCLIFDLKTTSRGSDEYSWQWQRRDWQYDFSLAWYAMVLEEIGLETVGAYWIAVETRHPWTYNVHPFEMQELGMSRLECLQSLVTIGRGRKYGWEM